MHNLPTISTSMNEALSENFPQNIRATTHGNDDIDTNLTNLTNYLERNIIMTL